MLILSLKVEHYFYLSNKNTQKELMSTGKSQIEVVTANGFSTLEKGSSSRTSTYEDFVQNSELFWDTLRDFFQSSGGELKIPVVEGKRLDLHRLFIEVTSRGGLEEVINNRRCKEVIEVFKFKTAVTNAAHVLKTNYRKTLLQFEHAYFQAPRSTFQGNGMEMKPGAVVTGRIDEKFGSGYLVTMKMGSKEFKGVIFHTSSQEDPTTHRNKRAKSSHGRPKFPRSSYNFFFAEQHVRIKAEGGGRKGPFTKEIAEMWKNLSESDKKVYQEIFLKDKERYKMELSQDKASKYSYAAKIVAATDAVETVAETNATETVAAVNAAETVAATNAAEAVAETDAAETVADTDAAEAVAETDAMEIVAETDAAETVAATNAAEAVAETNAAETVADTDAVKAVAETDAAEAVAETDAMEIVAETDAAETIAVTDAMEIVAETNAAKAVAETDAAETVAATDAAETVVVTDPMEIVAETDAAKTVAETDAAETVAATDAAETVAVTDAMEIVAATDAAASASASETVDEASE
ncbi:PREDICTED: putative high mobility group B protein 11 [Camelina sativa]|uniref:High mobility group B protein 11 n=1 Tax=Camelina sativa TaxID=90675 RepID=A0ABM0X3M5_CAMSA|nr:PREDICTED: putative high mobility group B protein 11 [Camelina sativa]